MENRTINVKRDSLTRVDYVSHEEIKRLQKLKKTKASATSKMQLSRKATQKAYKAKLHLASMYERGRAMIWRSPHSSRRQSVYDDI